MFPPTKRVRLPGRLPKTSPFSPLFLSFLPPLKRLFFVDPFRVGSFASGDFNKFILSKTNLLAAPDGRGILAAMSFFFPGTSFPFFLFVVYPSW